MRVIAIIPARYASSRFPGKPLVSILGKPMIWWVYDKVSQVSKISETIVATDDIRIYDTVISFGGIAVMTGTHPSGTDRIAEACKDRDFDVVLNIQGDEPLVSKESIIDLLSAFNDSTVQMATLRKKVVSTDELSDPSIAKLIIDAKGNAIYFSRSVIPYNRDNTEVQYYKHIGMYGYTREFLQVFVSLPPSALEKVESLEQLRAIENGYSIRTVETDAQSIGVDLPEHIKVVESYLREREVLQ